MKKLIIFFFSLFCFVIAEAKATFEVGGRGWYRHIRVINQTSQENFSLRLVLLTKNEDGSYTRGEVYGTYNLKGKNDVDTNTRLIKAGQLVGIEMPKDFPVEVEVSLEYRNNFVRVILTDENTKFDTF